MNHAHNTLIATCRFRTVIRLVQIEELTGERASTLPLERQFLPSGSSTRVLEYSLTALQMTSLSIMASSYTTSMRRNPLKESLLDLETLLILGAIQPKGCSFKSSNVLVAECIKSLEFQESWYDGRSWLEYSEEDDVASCYYCRMFKPKVNG